MRSPLALLLFVAAPLAGVGQNLVPNGSFEEYINCPSALGNVANALAWTGFTGSPDYFHACSDTALTDVPGNAFGVQPAFDGNGYIGCYTYKEASIYRECVQAQLLAPLVVGEPVSLSMSVSPGGFGLYENNTVQLVSNGIGMRFSTQPISFGLMITDQAALHLDDILSDTATWITLSGTYLPDSAYAYVQIGNFFSDTATSTAMLDTDAVTEAAYAFIDDVCVSPDPQYCSAETGVHELQVAQYSIVSDNSSGCFVVHTSNTVPRAARVAVHNASGQVVRLLQWPGRNECRIPSSDLPSGLYTVTITGAPRALRVVHVAP